MSHPSVSLLLSITVDACSLLEHQTIFCCVATATTFPGINLIVQVENKLVKLEECRTSRTRIKILEASRIMESKPDSNMVAQPGLRPRLPRGLQPLAQLPLRLPEFLLRVPECPVGLIRSELLNTITAQWTGRHRNERSSRTRRPRHKDAARPLVSSRRAPRLRRLCRCVVEARAATAVQPRGAARLTHASAYHQERAETTRMATSPRPSVSCRKESTIWRCSI